MEPELELYEADKPIELPGARKRKLIILSFKIFVVLIFIIFAYNLLKPKLLDLPRIYGNQFVSTTLQNNGQTRLDTYQMEDGSRADIYATRSRMYSGLTMDGWESTSGYGWSDSSVETVTMHHILLSRLFIPTCSIRLTTTVQHTPDNKTLFILRQDEVQDICLGW